MKKDRREFNKWLDNITDQFPDEREPNGCYDKSCCDSYKGQLASAYYEGFQDGAERVYSDFDLKLKEGEQVYLKEDVDRLVAALEFYANESNWLLDSSGKEWDFSEDAIIAEDDGNKARQALKNWERGDGDK